MIDLMNHHLKSLKLLTIIFNLFLLDYFAYLVLGQLLDLEGHCSIILNNKLYFFGGDSFKLNLTNQIIYLDLSTSFTLGQTLPIKQIFPKSSIPPFAGETLALGGAN